MPHTDSLLAQIITGHLLIEERLTALLVTCARDGKFLEHARLSFKQRVLLAQAFALRSDAPHIWRFIDDLNRLRNKLAHNIEPVDIAVDVDRLVGLIADANKLLPDPVGNTNSRLTLAVSVCCGHLFGLRLVHARLGV